MRRILLCINWLLLLHFSLLSQNRTITGSVTDPAGEPLPGTTVSVKDSGIGTITDGNGFYSLKVPDDTKLLVFTFLRYKTMEVVVFTNTSGSTNSA